MAVAGLTNMQMAASPKGFLPTKELVTSDSDGHPSHAPACSAKRGYPEELRLLETPAMTATQQVPCSPPETRPQKQHGATPGQRVANPGTAKFGRKGGTGCRTSWIKASTGTRASDNGNPLIPTNEECIAEFYTSPMNAMLKACMKDVTADGMDDAAQHEGQSNVNGQPGDTDGDLMTWHVSQDWPWSCIRPSLYQVSCLPVFRCLACSQYRIHSNII